MAALTMPEARPLSEAAKATMHTNSGAGFGTATSVRSTAMAISAVAVAKAGPQMARQSICMTCSHARRKYEAWSMRIVSVEAGFSAGVANARSIAWTRFSDHLI